MRSPARTAGWESTACSTSWVAAPWDADVVVANAYPNDGTLVSVRHKSLAPLRLARPDASRVLRVPGTTNWPDAKKRAAGRGAMPCVGPMRWWPR